MFAIQTYFNLTKKIIEKSKFIDICLYFMAISDTYVKVDYYVFSQQSY